jgi:hypothetical protein
VISPSFQEEPWLPYIRNLHQNKIAKLEEQQLRIEVDQLSLEEQVKTSKPAQEMLLQEVEEMQEKIQELEKIRMQQEALLHSQNQQLETIQQQYLDIQSKLQNLSLALTSSKKLTLEEKNLPLGLQNNFQKTLEALKLPPLKQFLGATPPPPPQGQGDLPTPSKEQAPVVAVDLGKLKQNLFTLVERYSDPMLEKELFSVAAKDLGRVQSLEASQILLELYRYERTILESISQENRVLERQKALMVLHAARKSSNQTISDLHLKQQRNFDLIAKKLEIQDKHEKVLLFFQEVLLSEISLC